MSVDRIPKAPEPPAPRAASPAAPFLGPVFTGLVERIADLRPERRGVVAVLPATWGATALCAQLDEPGALTVRGLPGAENESGLAIRMALEAFDDRPAAVLLDEWLAASAGRAPLLLVDQVGALDAESARLISQLIARRKVFAVILLAVLGDLPAPLAAQQRAGTLVVEEMSALEPGQIRCHLGDLLGGDPSSAITARVAALSGGHRALMHWLLRAAHDAGVLHRTGAVWEWRLDESGLIPALAAYETEIVGAIRADVRDRLTTIALAGSIPEHDAAALLSERFLARLRRQRLITLDPYGTSARRSYTLRSPALAALLRHRVGPAEDTHRWYTVGTSLHPSSGGPDAELGAARWRLRAEGGIAGEETQRLLRTALRRGRFAVAIELAAPHLAVHPGVRVLAARAHYAHGDVEEALALLRGLRAGVNEDWRQAYILAMRIAVFHRRPGMELARLLRVRWAESTGRDDPHLDGDGVPGLERIMRALQHDRGPRAAAAMLPQAGFRTATAAFTARLWVGAELGFGADPKRGRHLLQSLLDDCTREPDGTEFIEPVLVLLLMLSVQSDETGFAGRMMQLQTGGLLRQSHALSAVLDLITATAALEADRAHTALRLASDVARQPRDPYGIRPLAWAVAAGAARATGEHEPEDAVPAGAAEANCLPYLEGIRQAILLFARDPEDPSTVAELEKLSRGAEAEDRVMERFEILVVAARGGSEYAARELVRMVAPFRRGRTGIARDFAEARLSRDPAVVLRTAAQLQERDASSYALVLVAGLWPHLDRLRGGKREAIRLVLRARAAQAEPSLLVDTLMADLALSERERLILASLRDGESTGTVARRVNLSARTVEGILSRLMRRFGCANRIELLDLGLV
ncbi:LuxR C-terminal-related transcriptional regulator [Sediminivirga luteola]|uniref:HTH luxR-type domain-containing protein n=1 Tax=Sediminivirga luteola TaxID=1774748 RepID=A0A8J2TXK3_9MICO|nr:LuxR C-terminal-related transcriptional regulator [Sediminivirga luteola]MCI2266655.1 LuxR C-terminal-related transcriptional regulator [Sediminivirga luteola]GGA12981.1 hypothetical protein GCM10011333_14860 [Sediminivirga luteola]